MKKTQLNSLDMICSTNRVIDRIPLIYTIGYSYIVTIWCVSFKVKSKGLTMAEWKGRLLNRKQNNQNFIFIPPPLFSSFCRHWKHCKRYKTFISLCVSVLFGGCLSFHWMPFHRVHLRYIAPLTPHTHTHNILHTPSYSVVQFSRKVGNESGGRKGRKRILVAIKSLLVLLPTPPLFLSLYNAWIHYMHAKNCIYPASITNPPPCFFYSHRFCFPLCTTPRACNTLGRGYIGESL